MAVQRAVNWCHCPYNTAYNRYLVNRLNFGNAFRRVNGGARAPAADKIPLAKDGKHE